MVPSGLPKSIALGAKNSIESRAYGVVFLQQGPCVFHWFVYNGSC